MSAVRSLLRAPIHFVTQASEPVYAPLVVATIRAAGMADPPAMIGQDVLRGTVVAVAPDTSRPVLWQVATLD